MTEGGISLWTLQNMYERATYSQDGIKKFADGSGTVVVPESGNKYPDILDECRYELDFMSRMKVQPDEKTWGKYSGMYYHSITDHRWRSLTNRPDYIGYEDIRIIRPPTFAATLNYAACAAQGARLWKAYDAEYANELIKSAKEAYQLMNTITMYHSMLHKICGREQMKHLTMRSQLTPTGQPASFISLQS